MPSLSSRLIGPSIVSLILLSPAWAADPQAYSVTIHGSPSKEIQATLEASAQLVTLRGRSGVAPFAVIERARNDAPRLLTALNSFGYYAASVKITIGSHDLSDAALPVWLDKVPNGREVPIDITVEPGPRYRLGTIAIEGDIPEQDRKALKIESGEPAIASNVLDARQRLQAALQEDGFALAVVDPPIAYADDAKHLLNIAFKAKAGRQVEIGTISFNGLKDVDERFARRAMKLKSGERFKPSRIDAARQALMDQGVFSGISVHAADHLSDDGRIPITFDVQERPRHAVSILGTYSTDLGISLATTWSHRNLFGNAEQLNLSTAGTGLGNATAGLGYNLRAQFIKPLFLRLDQTLEIDAGGVKQDLDAYGQTAENLAAYLRRRFSKLWSASIGLGFMQDDVMQENMDFHYQLLSVPMTVTYDSTGLLDPLRDALSGGRASLSVTPTQAFGAHSQTFFNLQISGSTYFSFSDDGRSVVALRALEATILGGSNLSLPPDQRLYAGGSATVRGYAFQSIGPRFADGTPIGAKSVDAASIEFRQRLFDDWGAAAFIDAGQASADGAPFNGEIHIGAGVGARYYTPIGPVRLDVAVPLTRQQGDGAFQIYIGLGQAF
jgi:translocation and assembly module TamA